MNTYKYLNPLPAICRSLDQTISSLKGNVLVYLIVVVLIFGVLGITIVSLFTTATTSSATPNDSRRAYYVAESGIRYALSMIRNSDFNDNFIESLNSTPSYNLTDGGSFWINVFSPWFEYNSTSVDDLNLTVPNAGKIPENFTIPNITLVNWDDFYNSSPNPPPDTSYETITGFSATPGNTSLTIGIADADPSSFIVGTDDIVCLAVRPTDADSLLQAGEDIYVELDAEDVFPPSNGSIRIVTDDGQLGDYYYNELIPDPPNNKVQLTKLAALPGSPSFTEITNFASDDWVVLSLNNYRVLATGKSGDVEITVGNDKHLNIFSYGVVDPLKFKPAVLKLSDLAEPVIVYDDTSEDPEITLGGSGSGPAFGDIWYSGDLSIGNDNNFCQAGRCLFGIGIRAFFTLGYSGVGEGFIFTLISAGGDPPENTANSAGGDIEQSELLGYAGDSRTDIDGTTFVDGSGEGLLPPKFGLEFDTRTNYDPTFEQSLTPDPGYCTNASSLKADTRNDPVLPVNNPTHAVQNVFWGNTDLRYALCRGNDQTYDDNRHDAEGPTEKWAFPTGDIVLSSPAVGDDGTVYVGSNDNNVYAINPDGTEKWNFPTAGNVESSPAVGSDGTIYIGSRDDNVYAINPDGTEKWSKTTGGDVISSPVIGSDGTIYIASDDFKLYALDPVDGSEKWTFNDATGPPSRGRPALDEARNRIYISDRVDTLYALDLTDRLNSEAFPNIPNEWMYNLGDGNELMPGIDLTTGAIYTDEQGNELRALNPDGSSKWVRFVGSDINSTPAVGADGTVYFGTDLAQALFAREPINGNPVWQFTNPPFGAVNTNPAIGPDGSIYAGSDDGRQYAVNAIDGSERWRFPLPAEPNIGPIRSSTAVGPDGTLYFGSVDSNVYAVTPFAVPRNFRDETVEDQKLIISDDYPPGTFSTTPAPEWLTEGPWAVRMEITRETVNIDGEDKGRYTLQAWVEKCIGDCSTFVDGIFRDTRVEYNVAGRPPKLEQTVTISATDHDKFERFLFGFTTAAQAGDTQQAIVRDFELTFSRPGDPVVTVD